MVQKVIHFDNLKEFHKNLTIVDGDIAKSLRTVMNVAADIVVQETKPLVPLGPAKGGHARDSIVARSTFREARVKGGGSRFPYYPWLEFGGVLKKSNVKRKRIPDGNYLYPALELSADRVYATLYEGLLALSFKVAAWVD